MTLRPHIISRLAVIALSVIAATPTLAASDLQPAPRGALADAPRQYTRFEPDELIRGVTTLAFGSDLRIGARKVGVHKFTTPIRIAIQSKGKPDRASQMRAVVEEYSVRIPALRIAIVEDVAKANIVVRLIAESDFAPALAEALGQDLAKALLKKTDAQCMTNAASSVSGEIVHVESLVIVDQGEDVFRDCAYHELLHAFGLPGHDQTNPWTTLNQDRLVGYLSVYDETLIKLLYHPKITPGMSPAELRKALPGIIEEGRFGN